MKKVKETKIIQDKRITSYFVFIPTQNGRLQTQDKFLNKYFLTQSSFYNLTPRDILIIILNSKP